MDPNETLRLLREAIRAYDREEAGEDNIMRLIDAASEVRNLAEALDIWVTKGGFLPSAWAPKPVWGWEAISIAERTGINIPRAGEWTDVPSALLAGTGIVSMAITFDPQDGYWADISGQDTAGIEPFGDDPEKVVELILSMLETLRTQRGPHGTHPGSCKVPRYYVMPMGKDFGSGCLGIFQSREAANLCAYEARRDGMDVTIVEEDP